MMHGTLTLDGPGLVSARMENGAHIDAAISPGNDIAGIEIEVTNLVVHLGEQPSYRGAQTLSLSMRPGQLRDFLTVVAAKTGFPLFNEGQWRGIASALQIAANRAEHIAASIEDEVLDAQEVDTEVFRREAREARGYADRIEEALLRG